MAGNAPNEICRRFAELAAHTQDQAWLIDVMAAAAQPVQLPAGTTIFSQGSPCSSIAFLVRGSVRVFKRSPNDREVTLYRVHAGEACIFTTCCVLREADFPADAVTEEEVEALVVDGATFRDWYKNEAFWQRFVITLVLDRLGQLLELVDSVVFQRTDARLARFLLTRAAGGRVSLTHDSAANEIGTAREVVTRILDRFASLGIVRTQRGAVEILNAQRLGEIADPDATSWV